MAPKKSGAVGEREGLMPLPSFRCFFLGGFFAFLCHRLVPPFQSAEAEGCVKISR